MSNLTLPASPQTWDDPLTAARNRYKNISLTELESEEALANARKEKHFKLQSKSYWDGVNTEPKYPTFNASQLYFKITNSLLRIDGYSSYDGYDEIVKTLCRYFTDDATFEDESYRLSKGLLLMGGVGSGKTTLLKLFHLNQKQSFNIDHAKAIADRCNQEGNKEPISESYLKKFHVLAKHEYGQSEVGLMVDDIGTEDSLKLYGNECHPVAELLEMHYRAWHNGSKRLLHATTNLTPTQLEAKYGTRIYSRMKELFNVVSFPDTAPDLRTR